MTYRRSAALEEAARAAAAAAAMALVVVMVVPVSHCREVSQPGERRPTAVEIRLRIEIYLDTVKCLFPDVDCPAGSVR